MPNSIDAAPLKRRVASPVALVYGVYAWLVFGLCLSLAVFVAAIVPGLTRRRRWVGQIARWPLALAGISTQVHDIENMPSGHCVVVANHASYLDGVLLQAFLPPRFSFVIKGEMQGIPLAGFLLKRIGSRFVNRNNLSSSARDARALLRASNNGESLAMFPEGTFILEPGLGRFRAGAFAAAIKSAVPLVPVVIRGSRNVLPAKSALPRRGAIDIVVLPPIAPSDPAFENTRSLIKSARTSILSVLDEADLTA